LLAEDLNRLGKTWIIKKIMERATGIEPA